MLVTDKQGREVEIEIYGRYEDDIEITEAQYVDESLGEVSDETIDYILDTYSSEIYDEWFENKVCEAEYYYDIQMDR
jgi:hypothetical protein